MLILAEITSVFPTTAAVLLKKSHCLDFQTKTEQHWTLFEPGLLNARGSVR